MNQFTGLKLIFIGERPSATAYRRGWTWHDGRLAAKTLFGALDASGIDRRECGFVNLFGDHPESRLDFTSEAEARASVLASLQKAGVRIIAMGLRVAGILETLKIDHVRIVHPAARGAIRANALYAAHVADVLGRKVDGGEG